MTKPQPRWCEWRHLDVGSTVWAAFGSCGWRPAIVTKFGRNRGQRTIVHLNYGAGCYGSSHGKRMVSQLAWRKPNLKGKDRPMPPYKATPLGVRDEVKDMLDKMIDDHYKQAIR